ncbi:FG-GAP repeat domain-containing protein [Streptomyces xylophagus]|uniref:FG-GAP repeat domain-containing protein n=1 Tax=Streptomyces xylophagus TaxID=285514 RepID=UPI0005BE20E4|nr:VCBS repeat-containing protein [Streptomyces xylophagus]
MKSRVAVVTLAVCTALAPLSGCGGNTSAQEPSPSSGAPTTAAASRTPAPGKGSKDPDDLNGDGHRDLVVPVFVGRGENFAADERIGVVYGSAKGLDPSTRAVYGRGDLGLPAPGKQLLAPKNSVAATDVTTADLDGDGFPDFVTTVPGTIAEDDNVIAPRTVPYITWGGSSAKSSATPVQLPQSATKLGIQSVVRGDFDGDGHHDLAGLAYNHSSLVVMYGPFTRSGAPARTDTSLPWADGELIADAIDPSGAPRATSLLLHAVSDGEQSGNTLYTARRGSQLSSSGKQLRSGNAHAFGDFDGDGQRDVAVGDDGSRNDEPGYETEPAEVDGSLAVYPGDGGASVTYRLPEAPGSARTPYGPGGYVSADPDGDGRDGILVATYEGATLLDGTRRTTVLRDGPGREDGKKIPAKWRHARPAGAADFDGDGKDELVLNWGADARFGTYGERPTRWWITDGTTHTNKATFTTTDFAPRSS